MVPRNSYKRGNPGLRDQHTAPRCMALTHREPRRSSTSPHAIAATRDNQRTQVKQTTGAAARRRGAVAAAAKLAKARSPRLSHPWHACRREERRRCGDVLAFSALELLGFEARAAAKPRRHLPNSAEGASIWLKARRWRRGFARTLRLASCCLCGLKTINRAGSREGLSAGPWQRANDWKGLRDGRKRW